MKIRENKELLILLLDQVLNCPDDDFYGMCGEIKDMSHRGIISFDEQGKLFTYLDNHRVDKNVSRYDYWWVQRDVCEFSTDDTGHDKKPRIDWIHEQITKLTKKK